MANYLYIGSKIVGTFGILRFDSEATYPTLQYTINGSTFNSVYGVPDPTIYYTKSQTDSAISAAVSTAVASVFVWKGVVATVGDLPSSGVSVGWVYHVTADGIEYAWTGSAWESLGGVTYVLPAATTTTLGGVKVDGTSITITDGVISATAYTLPTSSTTTLGGVKVDGSTITINGSGVISVPSVVSNPVSGASSGIIIWVGTQAEYDAIGTKSSTTLYFIKEA